MKLRFGKTLIETSHIETVIEQFDSCGIRFVSGETITIYCKDSEIDITALFIGTPAELMEYIQKADNIVSEEILKSAMKSEN